VLTYNFWWAITNVMVHVPAGVLIAVLLNVQGLWLKRIYRAIYILPVVSRRWWWQRSGATSLTSSTGP
jgi:arabinogalactan oligomer / maltooligosaccharide transport system permease protein